MSVMPVTIVTDSTSEITQEEARQIGVLVVPLHVNFGGKTYKDGVDLTSDGFFEILERESVQTSQANVEEILEVWGKAPKKNSIVSIHLSSKLSEMHERVMEASLCRENVHVVDSISITIGLRVLVLAALDMAHKGMDAETIARRVEELRDKVWVFGHFDTLRYLKRGGRISTPEFLMGSIVQVKPVVTIKDGKLAMCSKPRTTNKALERVAAEIIAGGKMSQLTVVHARAAKEAAALRDKLQEAHPGMQISICRLGTALGVHSGPGFVGGGGLRA